MVLPMALLFLVPLLLFVFLFLGHASRPWKQPYPPGPRGLPIIGNMLMSNHLNHRGLAKLSRKFGGLLHLRFGVVPIIVVSSPDIAQQILQVQDYVFSNRPATIAISYLTYNRADLAFADYGPVWRRMRKVCVLRLFSRKRAKSWACIRDEVDKMVGDVAVRSGTPVNVGKVLLALTRNITYRAAFGSSCEDGQLDKFLGMLQEFSELCGAFNVADFIPWLRWMDPQGINGRLKKTREALDGFIDSVIRDHIERKIKHNIIDEDGETDMVDDLLEFYSEEATSEDPEGPHNSVKLTLENIKAIIQDVMFGGTETIASVTEWVLTELLGSPKELRRVQQELATVVGLNRRVDDTHLEGLTYLRCALKETLRLHPPLPLLLHETKEDAEVSGYFIPKGSSVKINAYAIGRDPDSWPNPEKFDPSRFSDPGAPDLSGSDFRFIPFGSGRRSCPGMQLGMYALQTVAANLLHCFTWRFPDGVNSGEVDTAEAVGLTVPRATRLVAVPTTRLTCPI